MCGCYRIILPGLGNKNTICTLYHFGVCAAFPPRWYNGSLRCFSALWIACARPCACAHTCIIHTVVVVVATFALVSFLILVLFCFLFPVLHKAVRHWNCSVVGGGGVYYFSYTHKSKEQKKTSPSKEAEENLLQRNIK